MGTRKNARFLSPSEREDFVRACVSVKADIVNPGAPPSARYSKWDEFVAVHTMIQNAFAPGDSSVNFGHGGPGAFSFLSWHRYFLFLMEQELQSHVPGVMIPYWDWSDPASIMTDTFLGSNGGAGDLVRQGYFAVDRPGTGGNTTPLPAWWPPGLEGWRLPGFFPSNISGGLRRDIDAPSSLPEVGDFREVLALSSYSDFQNSLESGAGISSGHDMHNDMHRWMGGQMNTLNGSPLDPMFYLIHANVDRLWAMWQTDGHENTYPVSGGALHHHRNDLMYPWVGGAPGYGTNAPIQSSIPMPDFGGLGPLTNADTLDFRANFGYTYDTIAIMGIGLDRTGSMYGLTPDPMVVSQPDVTKWEAAKRGVSAFLQDCETAQDSGAVYVMAGVKTFTRIAGGNRFFPVFGAPDYGLIKNGTSFSKAGFDSNIAGINPTGTTPLAEALQDIQDTLVEPPFSGVPSDEQRYLAMLTDGNLTSGAPMNSISDGSFGRTAVFAMGFGTGLDVSYPTLADMVAKGRNLPTEQIFHGENAGTIDKFFSNSLASAIGFTTIFDPVLELFAGEFTHVDFKATSAEDVFFITAQGMDFQDDNWTFMLHGPGNRLVYGENAGHRHEACHHCCPGPHVSVKRANGRLSLMVQRGNTGYDCWVGNWQLMVAYKARRMDKMLMPELGEWLFPVSAGPVRGERYARLLLDPKARTATRNVHRPGMHGLDVAPSGTNASGREACSMLVNIYARTNLRLHLLPNAFTGNPGDELRIDLHADALFGKVEYHRAFARLISPAIDLKELIPEDKLKELLKKESRYSRKSDLALLLARIEKQEKINFIRDKELELVSHNNGPLHVHEPETKIPGMYHLGVYVEGSYFSGDLPDPGHGGHAGHSGHGGHQSQGEHQGDGGQRGSAEKKGEFAETRPAEAESFSRILNISLCYKHY